MDTYLKDKIERALNMVFDYGGYDGGHHKQWVLDQVVRILSDDYDEWVREYEDGTYGPRTFHWDVGIAP